MKEKNVAAGVIRQGEKVLLMRRAPGEKFEGEWEYPGGKFELGETGQECLARELKEELDIDAIIGQMITVAELHLQDCIFKVHAYWVDNFTGTIKLTVHDKMEWVSLNDVVSHSQLQADKLISKKISEQQ